jgi:iron complex outermembrane recepter protein
MNRALPLLILTLLFPWQAAAQNAADLEVVVTADRVDKVETETTATVTVITAEDIQASGAASLVELLEALPGVQFKSYSGPSQAMISMGGFGENSYGRVVVLVDGRLQNNIDMRSVNWMSVPLASVERVEVLHGGGGVLYGSGAVGGVVNIITRETDSPYELEAGGSYGSFMTHSESVQAGASNELGSLRAGGEFYSSEGYRDRSASNYASATVAGSLYPSDRLAFDLDFGYTRSFYEMPGGLSEAQYKDDPTQAVNQADESTEHELGVSVAGEYLLSDSVTLDTLIGYGYKNMAPDQASYSQYDDRISSTLDVQPKLIFDSAVFGRESRVVTGADLRGSTLSNESYSDAERETKTNEFEIDFVSAGAYLIGDLALGESVGVSAGFRYDAARISAVNIDETIDDSKEHTGSAWSIGLRWNPTEESKVYLRHEGLFRYPFSDEQAALFGFGFDAFLDDLEAERGVLYEIGGLYSVSERLRVDLRGYLMDMRDEIVFNSVSFQNENLDNTRRVGMEGSVTMLPFDDLELSGSYAYVRPTFTNGDNDGKQIPLVSNHELEGGLKYFASRSLELGVEASYRSEFYKGGDNPNTEETIDGYLLVNSSLGFKPKLPSGELVLRAGVDNILDEEYVALSYYSSLSGNTSFYPAPGRSFTLSGTYRY